MIQTMLTFPAIDPEIFSVSLLGIELALRWYALAYIVGILIGWFIVVRAVSTPALWADNRPPLTREQVEDLVFWIILGIILGGRGRHFGAIWGLGGFWLPNAAWEASWAALGRF